MKALVNLSLIKKVLLISMRDEGERVAMGKKNSRPGARVIGDDHIDMDTSWPCDLGQDVALSPVSVSLFANRNEK